MHPRTRAHAAGWTPSSPDLHLVEPVGYLDFLALQSRAAAVLTDSGGVQEETTALGIPCFTLRDNTERPITVAVGTNTLLGLKPERIAELPALIGGKRSEVPPYWDGAAAARLADVLVSQSPIRRRS
jgi:UDP-N-acetylglucosamine 2-epimerase (non-hydrolysing)